MDEATLRVGGLVAYDGTDYHGYQYQVGVPTVQGALENALSEFCSPLGRVSAAGRTDTGVHANGQVIVVEVKWRHDAEQLQRAWNAHLPLNLCEGIATCAAGLLSAVQRTVAYVPIPGLPVIG